MPWIRCPYGCYFEMLPLNWEVYARSPTSPMTCKRCHRSNWAMFFQEDNKSAAVDAVNGVVIPIKNKQLEIETSIKMRISKLMGNINWGGYNQEKEVSIIFHNVVKMLVN